MVLGISTEETEDATQCLCYCGNVNTKIAISMYCECQSVEIEKYILQILPIGIHSYRLVLYAILSPCSMLLCHYVLLSNIILKWLSDKFGCRHTTFLALSQCCQTLNHSSIKRGFMGLHCNYGAPLKDVDVPFEYLSLICPKVSKFF